MKTDLEPLELKKPHFGTAICSSLLSGCIKHREECSKDARVFDSFTELPANACLDFTRENSVKFNVVKRPSGMRLLLR